MALLDLVDKLLGDILRGNLFTDTSPFVNAVLQRPAGADSGIPNTDSRLLTFRPEDPHPHPTKAGSNPSEHVVYANPPARPLHDHKPDYTDTPPDDPGGKDGYIIPTKRTQIYQNNVPAGTADLDIQSQRAGMENNTNDLPKVTQTQAAPGIEKDPQQIPVGHTPQPLSEREKLYAQANDRNRHGSPLADLFAFHRAVEANPALTKGQQFNADRRDDTYFIPEEDKQVKSNIGGGPNVGEESIPTSKPTLGDLQSAVGKPPTRDLLIKGPEDPGGRPRDLQQPTLREDIYRDFDSQGVAQAPDGTPPTVPLDTIKNGTGRRDFAPEQGQLRNRDPGYRGGNTYDDGSVELVNRGGPFASIPGVVSPLRFFDVFAVAHWLRSVSQEVLFIPRTQTDSITGQTESTTSPETIAKSAQWIASQFLLASFNPADVGGYGLANAVWNPLSLPVNAITRGQAFGAVTAGAALAGVAGTGYEQNTLNSEKFESERLVQMRRGTYVESSPVHRLSKGRSPLGVPGFIGEVSKAGKIDTLEQEKAPFKDGISVQAQVDQDGPLSLLIPDTVHKNIYTSDTKYSDYPAFTLDEVEKAQTSALPVPGRDESKLGQATKLRELFRPMPRPPLAQGIYEKPVDGIRSWVAKTRSKDPTTERGFGVVDAPGINAAITDVKFIGEDLVPGSGGESSGIAKKLIEEGDIYMPFMFQDLRDGTKVGSEKFLYFRAFLKPGLAETFTPDWQIERYYGRVDQVPIYMGTLRNLSVAFDVVAWGPADLPVMWRKLNKLQSMVYPFFNKSGFFKAGPIIRMRIGDLFANQTNKGLPGYITSMDWSYDDGIWNLETDFRVPRKVSVSIGFTVVHDGNPGTYPYRESGDILPGEDVNSQPTDNTQGSTFGAGKVSAGKAKGSLQINVSPAEIRKIFETVRNKSGN